MGKVVIVIQARVASSRLPGKVLEPVCSKPLLWHVIERAKRCQKANQIVVATPMTRDDLQVVSIADECGVTSFQGSEHDVLERFYEAAGLNLADVVVRMTADCPLIHPETVDSMVKLLEDEKADYVCVDPQFPGLETGVEVLTFDALEKAHRLAVKDYQKEHVTLYIREHPEAFKIALYQADPLFRRKDIRITVDEPQDLVLIRHLYDTLYQEAEIIDLRKVVSYLDTHPEKRTLNADVQMSRANQLSVSKKITDKIVKESGK